MAAGIARGFGGISPHRHADLAENMEQLLRKIRIFFLKCSNNEKKI
jgi:hypothetical protein